MKWVGHEISSCIVPEKELHQFVVRSMQKVGAKKSHAESLANLIVSADVRGHYSHGLNRLDYYMTDIADGNNRADVEPQILKQTLATAHVEGNNCLGPVVGTFCMDLAIEKAKNVGIGWVCAKGSNHFGVAGWYCQRAMDHGLLGMALTNSSPFVVHTRSKERTLGTNPISVGAKGIHGDEFLLDMATSAAALGKERVVRLNLTRQMNYYSQDLIELKERRQESVPLGWGVDRDGKPSTDPHEILCDGGLSPLGGGEECSGYKGYGLGMMVEIFCGILSGSRYGKNIRDWNDKQRVADLGHCFVAIDPGAFAPGFEGRMSDLIHLCTNCDKADDEEEILTPGSRGRSHLELCNQLGGIPFHQNQLDHADEIARKYNIEPIRVLI